MKKTALLAAAALAASVLPALACDEPGELRRALAQAQSQAQDQHRARAEAALARAEAAHAAMEDILELVYFPGLYRLKDGKALPARLAALKSAFESELRSAVLETRALGGDAKLDRRAQYLAEWGIESQVCSSDLKSCEQILTRERRDALFAAPAAPAEPRDPHE